jgi:hypothetical protein
LGGEGYLVRQHAGIVILIYFKYVGYGRNCLLKHVIEGKLEGRMEVTERRGRRRKQLLDDPKEKRRYWKLKEEALDRTVWRTRFGRGYGPVVRQTVE